VAFELVTRSLRVGYGNVLEMLAIVFVWDKAAVVSFELVASKVIEVSFSPRKARKRLLRSRLKSTPAKSLTNSMAMGRTD